MHDLADQSHFHTEVSQSVQEHPYQIILLKTVSFKSYGILKKRGSYFFVFI